MPWRGTGHVARPPGPGSRARREHGGRDISASPGCLLHTDVLTLHRMCPNKVPHQYILGSMCATASQSVRLFVERSTRAWESEDHIPNVQLVRNCFAGEPPITTAGMTTTTTSTTASTAHILNTFTEDRAGQERAWPAPSSILVCSAVMLAQWTWNVVFFFPLKLPANGVFSPVQTPVSISEHWSWRWYPTTHAGLQNGSSFILIDNPTQPATMVCKVEAQSEYVRIACTSLHVSCRFCVLSRWLSTKISASELRRKFIKSALFGWEGESRSSEVGSLEKKFMH